jgi:glutamate N-acetyltransferase/amino-acid N-acetyltransferase
MKNIKKNILPNGFEANGISCGIKASGKPDLALFLSKQEARCSAMFTKNSLAAAPVILDKYYLKCNNKFKAIIANSGNANCFNKKSGLSDARLVSSLLAQKIGEKRESVLVASTGIIGKKLPVDKIKSSLTQLVAGLSLTKLDQASRAIMTTDTFPKIVCKKVRIGSKLVTISGVAKGAGMIAPDMATLLVFIFTDANISQNTLRAALKSAVNVSFNCITVDGCMSTNDTVMIMANGLAGNAVIKKGKSLTIFSEALNSVCLDLAKMIVRDGEGASKFIEIKVREAKSYDEAKRVALGIANSNLFKTAIYGENPNFGRIVAAVGATGVKVKEKDIKARVSSLKKKYICVDLSLRRGVSEATIYTSDLTPEYIKINAEYS